MKNNQISVDEYILSFPRPIQLILEEVRVIIKI